MTKIPQLAVILLHPHAEPPRLMTPEEYAQSVRAAWKDSNRERAAVNAKAGTKIAPHPRPHLMLVPLVQGAA